MSPTLQVPGDYDPTVEKYSSCIRSNKQQSWEWLAIVPSLTDGNPSILFLFNKSDFTEFLLIKYSEF